MEYLKVLNTAASKDAETFPMHQQNIRSEDKIAKMHFSAKENEVLRYLPHISLNSLNECYESISTTSLHKPSCFPCQPSRFQARPSDYLLRLLRRGCSSNSSAVGLFSGS